MVDAAGAATLGTTRAADPWAFAAGKAATRGGEDAMDVSAGLVGMAWTRTMAPCGPVRS
jgi:hypothetical protein